MPLVFEVVFSMAVITRIEFIGDGRMGGEWDGLWGWMGSRSQAKSNI